MRFLGCLLKRVHAGETHLAWNKLAGDSAAKIELSSQAFAAGGAIPVRHAGAGVGDNISPVLAWSGVPASATELVVVVEDPDAPLPRPAVHAIAYAIPPTSTALIEGALSAAEPEGHARGKAFGGRLVYCGPQPVPGHGPHAYVFQIFALDRHLSFEHPPTKAELIRAMSGAVVARGRLVGFYEQ